MGGVVTGYLVLYNLASCAGWALVWWHVAQVVINGEEPARVWERAGIELQVVQSMAALEILHSMLRLVKSPLMTVFLQVMSRLVVLWVFTFQAKACQTHWSLPLMVGSWASVEVPRYLFYALNLLPAFSGSKMPYPLFWLRYSLFMVLYPSGISGELIQMYVALTTFYTWNTSWERFLFVFPILAYVPCGPGMILNMWGNRKSQFRKRKNELAGAGKPKPAPQGLVWPVTNEETGERSTSLTNKNIWQAAVAGVSPDAAEAVKRERKWRFGYAKHIETQVRLALETPKNAVQIAKDGLEYAQKQFQFVRDGKALSLSEAMETYKESFETGFIKGEGKREVLECRVDYKGKSLTGDALKEQLDLWVKRGTIEPSAAEAIKTVIDNPKWVDLSDRYFVLLGATSAMGPLDLLLACGANIIGIDLDRPFIWEKLINKARKSPGTLTFPMKKPQSECKTDAELFEAAGSNLLGATPEIANWLVNVCPGKALTIGNYTYLDGALHVQLSLASDAIMDKVCKARKDTSIAFLCTPTDVHNVSEEAHKVSAANYKNRPLWQKLCEGLFSMKKNAIPPVKSSGLYLHDGITVNQGPNYALAKRMQHWRAVLARDAGHVVSSNVAPSTSTASVTSNALFAAAYEGFKLFKALEVMHPETSSSAMLALLINDLRNPKSLANPDITLSNPMELFAFGAFHGGTFRTQFKLGTIGVVSVLYAYLRRYWLPVVLVFGALGYMAKFVILGA
mmetsp:Transcript_17654/g.32501  ORF Transcript_17654/g.32501 Transcript_17654/m.32501 type:complete len:737 (+) Transcript_17654:103-2313(+)